MSALDTGFDEDYLRRRMREVCALRPGMHLTVGIAAGDRELCLQSVGDSLNPAAAAPLATGCLTKLFTGAIAIESLQRHGVPRDACIGECLGLGDSFGSARLDDLLDHTHGWDTTTTNDLPLQADGCVDIGKIYDRLCAAGRIAAAGEMHCYANASAWLTTALAERIEGVSFAELITRQLFCAEEGSSLSWRLRNQSGAAAICGATGAGMEVSAAALLAFLKSFWRGERRAAVLAVPPGEIRALPGWSGAERGILSGWKYYGEGWFGHSSSRAGAYGVVRVQPEQRIAMFVCSKEQSCAAPATALFGRSFATFAPVKSPKLLPTGSPIEHEAYVGVFDVAATSLRIEHADTGLVMRAFDRRGRNIAREPFHVALLRPAADHLFYPEPMHAELFPYLQFVGSSHRPLSYIWNGKGVWRRS